MTVCPEKFYGILLRKGVLDTEPRKLKLHRERNSDAPSCPLYLNFRMQPEGPLSGEDVETLGTMLWEKIREDGVYFSGVAGIPRAGNPYAEVVSRLSGKPLFLLAKNECGHVICPAGFRPPRDPILLVNDVITQADSAFEALAALLGAGGTCRDIAALVDREQGGADLLERFGVRPHVLKKLGSQILPDLLKGKNVSDQFSAAVRDYLSRSRAALLNPVRK